MEAHSEKPEKRAVDGEKNLAVDEKTPKGDALAKPQVSDYDQTNQHTARYVRIGQANSIKLRQEERVACHFSHDVGTDGKKKAGAQ